MHLRRLPKRIIGSIAGASFLIAGVFVADQLFPPPLSRLSDLSAIVADRTGAPLRVFTNSSGTWRLQIEMDAVPERLTAMLLAREDRRFRWHPGVDPLALVRAMFQNVAAGSVVSGASTLTMQVARLLDPRPRTLGAKVIEAARALQLERRFSKNEILSMYLTLAPYGGNVEGVRAASQVWFGKSPDKLSTAEMALLVALPQAPSRLRPDRAPVAASAARDRVLEIAVAQGVLEPSEGELARTTDVPTRRQAWPFAAPHVSERLRRTHGGQTLVRTTIDGSLQRTVEALVRREIGRFDPKAGSAILVVDNATSEVRAVVGSPDYLSQARSGAIDMTVAVRSPGSALKPFIYGLAFDDGILRPGTIVADVSTRFGDYAPSNFDSRFRGDLTAAEALQGSLNVPAVLVLDKIGPGRFAAALRRSGAVLRFPEGGSGPGLPMALGGVGVTLRDVTTLYAGVANGGEVRPLRDVYGPAKVDPSDVHRFRLLSSSSARTILRILVDAPPPPGIVPAAHRRHGRSIAVKTGTSYGYRDAWAFGVSRTSTVGVWVGRPDGAPSPGRTGATTAAPLLYRVFDLLKPGKGLIGKDETATVPPPLLRRLDATRGAKSAISLPDPHRLDVTFPSPGSELASRNVDGSFGSVTLTARGGRRPLIWLINNRPIGTSPFDRSFEWTPRHTGSKRIAVIDADGRSAASIVEVR